ncbi:xanthine dehydrogenase/oxidase-like [Tubulanus polymorphus]|uniref:xanthine dehydrogenase/oxidase-like n=1 Tax=Tubulanus polymorphus TaxID=672921 RepID=UPI003DA67047
MAALDATQKLVFFVNGKKITEKDVDPEWTLLQYLRNNLLLTGAKLACGQAGCGACTVMVSKYDRHQKKIVHSAVPACVVFIGSVHGMAVTTVEGVGNRKKLHPIQERIAKYHGSQCGFCTPGMVMSMYTLLRNNPNPSISEIENAMQGNLCRCTGYRPIYQGFATFADKDFDCGMGDQCCKNKTVNDEMATNLTEGTLQPYNPDQELIFPNELQLSDVLERDLFHCKGKQIDWYRPTSLSELFKIKDMFPDASVIGGGLYIRKNKIYPNKSVIQLVTLSHIQDLCGFMFTDGGMHIGAACSLGMLSTALSSSIDKSPEGKQSFIAIQKMLGSVNQQMRNVTTIGGHIISCRNKSELIPILVACGCTMTVVSSGGIRQVPFDEKILSKENSVLKQKEIIKSIFIPHGNENEFLEVYTSNSVQVASVFRMVLEKDTSIIQELCIISSGLDGRIKLASETMKEAVGKQLCDSVVSSLSKILTDEIKPCTDNTGGAVQYRRSLILGFFFKFYLSMQMKINKNMESSSLASAVYDLPFEPLKASQVFEKVDVPAHDTIGKPLPQIMNPCHATGETIYIDDIPTYSNELFIAYVYSKHARAKIVSVDPSEALKVDGVVSYIDHNDVPSSNYFGPLVKDEELFATKLVTCCGQIIGAVAAENRDIARKAAKLVKVEYEVLKPIITIQDAIEADSFFDPVIKVNRGDVDAAFADADHIVEGELHTGSQEHFYMETNATVAVPVKENDEMIIYTTTQDLRRAQADICHALGLMSNKVAVKHKRIGGGFGGKQTRDALVCLTAAVAANKLQCPVRSSLERVEDLRITGRRHPFLGKYKVAFTKMGKIQALDIVLYSNGGHSLDFSGLVMEYAVLEVDVCYKLPNVRVKGYVCRTNLASNTGFRGFGRPQSVIISESWIEQMSFVLGMTPEQVREINIHKEVAPDCFDMEIDGKVLHQCWKDVIEQSKYEDLQKEIESFNSQNRWKKRGIAVVPTKCGNGFALKFMNQAAALVHVYLDGSVLLTHGGVEMGQGVHTKAIQVASHVLGISVDKIHITDISTDKIPNSICSSASICSDYIAMATKNACETIMERLKPFKESKPDAGWDGWVLSAWLENVYLSATGYYSVDDVSFDWEKGTGRRFDYLTYGAACSMVEIDCLTGEHKVLKTDIVMDVGASLNPGIDIGQIDGGFMQGYGLYMTEEVNVSPNGEVLTTGPASYNLPRFKNLPNEYNVTILKGSRNPRAIYSSKGIGEPPFILAASIYFASKKAILSARSDSGVSGYFRLDCPATAEKIRLACTDQFTKPFEQEDGGSKPWSVIE